MFTVGSIASNLIVFVTTGLASRWFGPSQPACPGCPTCPTCPGCPGSPVTPATPATPFAAEAATNGCHWSTILLVLTTVVSVLGPSRVILLLTYLVLQVEAERELQVAKVALRPVLRRNGIRAITQMGFGTVYHGRSAPEAYIGGRGAY